MKAPIRIAITGAAGQIGYSLLFRIANGDMLGREQPVILQFPVGKLLLLVLLWAFLHHLCAGVRFLALDLHLGVRLQRARASSMWVLAVSIGLTILLGVRLW